MLHFQIKYLICHPPRNTAKHILLLSIFSRIFLYNIESQDFLPFQTIIGLLFRRSLVKSEIELTIFKDNSPSHDFRLGDNYIPRLYLPHKDIFAHVIRLVPHHSREEMSVFIVARNYCICLIKAFNHSNKTSYKI